jgi:hypothetical protein
MASGSVLARVPRDGSLTRFGSGRGRCLRGRGLATRGFAPQGKPACRSAPGPCAGARVSELLLTFRSRRTRQFASGQHFSSLRGWRSQERGGSPLPLLVGAGTRRSSRSRLGSNERSSASLKAGRESVYRAPSQSPRRLCGQRVDGGACQRSRRILAIHLFTVRAVAMSILCLRHVAQFGPARHCQSDVQDQPAQKRTAFTTTAMGPPMT